MGARRRRHTWASIGLLLATVACPLTARAADAYLWTFSEDAIGAAPRGWEVLSGRWKILGETSGTNHVLVQAGPSLPGLALPAILTPVAPVADLDASVKVKATGLGTFETMGILVRWQNPGTTLSIRVDGTPGWIWVEGVREGRRSLLGGYGIDRFTPGRWYVLRVVARSEWLRLFFDGRFLGGIRDDHPAPGRVGLVAGPDAGVLLDDVQIVASADLGDAGSRTRHIAEASGMETVAVVALHSAAGVAMPALRRVEHRDTTNWGGARR